MGQGAYQRASWKNPLLCPLLHFGNRRLDPWCAGLAGRVSSESYNGAALPVHLCPVLSRAVLPLESGGFKVFVRRSFLMVQHFAELRRGRQAVLFGQLLPILTFISDILI